MSEREDLKQARAAIGTLVAHVEALEGALRELRDVAHRTIEDDAELDAVWVEHTAQDALVEAFARAALAGEPERCPECRTRFHDRPLAGCTDPWHTVPTGTTHYAKGGTHEPHTCSTCATGTTEDE